MILANQLETNNDNQKINLYNLSNQDVLILPIVSTVEGILIEIKDVEFPLISNMDSPMTVIPDVKITWVRALHSANE